MNVFICAKTAGFSLEEVSHSVINDFEGLCLPTLRNYPVLRHIGIFVFEARKVWDRVSIGIIALEGYLVNCHQTPQNDDLGNGKTRVEFHSQKDITGVCLHVYKCMHCHKWRPMCGKAHSHTLLLHTFEYVNSQPFSQQVTKRQQIAQHIYKVLKGKKVATTPGMGGHNKVL